MLRLHIDEVADVSEALRLIQTGAPQRDAMKSSSLTLSPS